MLHDLVPVMISYPHTGLLIFIFVGMEPRGSSEVLQEEDATFMAEDHFDEMLRVSANLRCINTGSVFN